MFSLYVQILQSLIQLCNCLCSNVVIKNFYDIAVLLFHETFGQNPLLDSQVPALNRHIPLKLLHHFYRLITVIHIPLIRLLLLFTYYGGVAFHHEQVTEALFRLCIIFFIYIFINCANYILIRYFRTFSVQYNAADQISSLYRVYHPLDNRIIVYLKFILMYVLHDLIYL